MLAGLSLSGYRVVTQLQNIDVRVLGPEREGLESPIMLYAFTLGDLVVVIVLSAFVGILYNRSEVRQLRADMDKRFDRIDAHFDRIESSLDRIQSDLSAFQHGLGLRGKLEMLEKRR
jgi:hypothetical protein